MSLQLTPGDNLNTVIAANPLVTKYTLPIGTYYLNDILTIRKNNLSIIGLGTASATHIYQQNVNRDGINIRADSVTIKNVSVHVPHSKRIALTVAGCNKSKVTNCFYVATASFLPFITPVRPLRYNERLSIPICRIDIANNKFLHNEVRGLYLQSCSNIVIKDNILSYFQTPPVNICTIHIRDISS